MIKVCQKPQNLPTHSAHERHGHLKQAAFELTQAWAGGAINALLHVPHRFALRRLIFMGQNSFNLVQLKSRRPCKAGSGYFLPQPETIRDGHLMRPIFFDETDVVPRGAAHHKRPARIPTVSKTVLRIDPVIPLRRNWRGQLPEQPAASESS
jgi:hypothetical protein